MNPKPVHYIGLVACIITVMASCRSSQSTTYTKPKSQPIQLPNVSQQMQVEVVPGETSNKVKGM